MTARQTGSQSLSRARISQFDIFGGGRFVYFLLALSLVVLLVDSFGLDLYYTLRGYYFYSQFGNLGWGGMFALCFLCIYAVFFLSARIFFRKSLWLGWIFFFCCLLLQVVIGFQGNIIAFKEYLTGSSAQTAFGGTVVEVVLNYWNHFSQLLFAHYHAVGQAYPRTMGENFAYSVALNSLLLAGGIVLAIALGAALRLVHWLAGKPPAPEPAPEDAARIVGFKALTGTARTIAVYIGAIALLFAASAPMIAMFIPGSVRNTEEIQNILWIGPLVVMLELARLALHSPRQDPPFEGSEAPKTTASERLVPKVHESLQRTLRRRVAAVHIPAGGGGIAEARNAIDTSEETVPKGELRYFLETLSPLHFERLAAWLASAALDRGRSALIICPTDAKAEVQSRFRQARRPLSPDALASDEIRNHGFGETWADLGRPPDKSTNIDVFVVSPDEIENLLLQRREYAEDLTRLGAIFVLNLHLMDLGLLSLSLRRLRAASRHPTDLIYIAQSQPLFGQGNRIQHLLPLESPVRQAADLDIPGKTARYISVWPAAPGDTILDPKHWPVEVEAVRQAKQVSPEINAFLWDARNSFQQHHWTTIIPPLLADQDQRDLIPYARQAEPERLGPPANPHPLAIIAAPDNLADALALGIGNGHSPDAGAVIVLRDYPLARFHFEKFRTDIASGRHTGVAARQALRAFREAYSSIAPRPKVGPVELALLLANEFAVAAAASRSGQDGWLQQSALNSFWHGEPADVLRQLQINTTKTGLVRLFELCVGHTVQIEQQRDAKLVRRYKLENPRRIEGATLGQMRIQAGSFFLPTTLPKADHGLAYAEGTQLVIAGAMYVVTGVDDSTIWLREEGGDAPRYEFARSYAILRAPERANAGEDIDRHDLAAASYIQEPNRQVRFEMASGYLRVARRTSMAYRYANPHTPFSSAEDGPRALPCSVQQSPKLRSASVLRLYSDRMGRARPRPATAGNRGASRQEACVAFTLATTLQDTLASLFPDHAHRIAVVTPQAAAIESDINPTNQTLPLRTAFALARQPALIELDERGSEPETEHRCRMRRDAMRAYEAYIDRFFKQARSRDGVTEPPGLTRLISFLIIEDCDHDLGVARVVYEERDRVFSIWQEFLEHCIKAQSKPNDSFYAFNSGQVSDVYLFQAALDIVSNMRRS